MNKLAMLCMLAFLLAQIMACSCLTDLGYTIGGSKNGKGQATVSEEDSLHGSHSIRLSVVPEKGKYARVYATFSDPMPVEELNQLSMWIKPTNGDGMLTLDIYLDSGVKLSTSRSWSTSELGNWQKIDAFKLDFNKKSLIECQKELVGERIKKIWIRLYNPGDVEAAAFLDYLKICDQAISFEPLEKEDVLAAPKSVSHGEKINYVITYGNDRQEPIDLVVVDQYDLGVIFLEADPAPDAGTNSIWTFRQLSPGEYGQIKIVARTHKIACKAEMSGSVSGNGLASVARTLSTDQPGYQVSNLVTLSHGKFAISASATTAVKPLTGSISSFSEHGSGSYSSDEMLSYSPSKIYIEQNLQANGSFSLVNVSGHLSRYNLSWHASHICENRVTRSSISEKYMQADALNLASNAGIQKKKTWMETDSNFTGIAEYDLKGSNRAANEMLVGSFKAKNRAIEWQNSSRKYPDKSWLVCPLGQCSQTTEGNNADQEDETD
jgi:hypothetical protein